MMSAAQRIRGQGPAACPGASTPVDWTPRGQVKLYLIASHPVPARPPLALGMCLTHLASRGDLEGLDLGPRFVSDAEELRVALAACPEGARPVLLNSNYLWTLEANLALSRLAKEIDPRCRSVHGGPSTPSYPEACETFLGAHPEVDVCVRGEGEGTLADLLATWLRGEGEAGVAGTTVRRSEGVHRYPDRERTRELESYPSAYLNGAFDGLLGGSDGVGGGAESPFESATLETNRGCPYGCTFCDWGSATLQKLRRFDLDRVRAEIEWIVSHRVPEIWIADANFGILPRDLEIAEALCEARRRTGFPRRVVVNYAKNTHAHLVDIVERFVDAGLVGTGIISLQTRDPRTLEVVRRRNIKPTEYDALRTVFRRKGLPLTVQMMLGLPGADADAFAADLRSVFDEPLEVQIFRTAVLPNSPMAEPAYREEHGIETNDEGLVLSTRAADSAAIDGMTRLARLFRAVHGYGILRYPILHLAQELGRHPIDLLGVLAEDAHGGRTELVLAELLDPGASDLDLLTTQRELRERSRAQSNWGRLTDAFYLWSAARFGASLTDAYAVTLEVAEALMPSAGRNAASLALDHDIVGWYRSLRNSQESDSGWDRAVRLGDLGPGELEIRDPHDLGGHPVGPRPGVPVGAWELESELSSIRRGSDGAGSTEGVETHSAQDPSTPASAA